MNDTSIIVVSWNAKRHLLACLRSLRQVGPRAETIVVDNASSDGSVEEVRLRFPGTRVIVNSENLGYARACNIGIRAGTRRYVCILNSDIVVREGCLGILAGYMDAHPRVGLTGPLLLATTGEPCRSTMSFPTFPNSLFRAAALDTFFPRSRVLGSYLMAWQPPEAAREVDVVNGAFWMIRRDALEEIGLLDEEFFFYGEDIDLCRRLATWQWLRVQHPRARAVHVGGASSARQPVRYYVEMQRANLHYWRKHRGAGAARAYAIVLVLQMMLRLTGYAVRGIAGAPGREARLKMRRSRHAIRWLLQNG